MVESDTATKYEIVKCKICKIKFQDLQSYADHLDSKSHRKCIMKEKFGRKYLEAKAKLENIEEKTVMPKDNPKLKLDKDSSSESSEDNVYTCEICRKICTGYVNFKSHLEGQKHKKTVNKAKLMKQLEKKGMISKPSEERKIVEESLLSRITTNTKYASSDLECVTCKKICNGPESFNQHCNSFGHQTKLAMQKLEKELKAEGLYPPTHEKDCSFARCEICQKSFTSVLSYQQHMEGITHLKQARTVEELSKIKDLFINFDGDSNKLQCKECGKVCSGPVPFNAHLQSSAHEKLKKCRAQLVALQKKHSDMVKIPVQQDSESGDTDEEAGVMLGCDVCQLVCNGLAAANDHFASTKHKKEVKQKSQFMKQQKEKILAKASGSQIKLKADKH